MPAKPSTQQPPPLWVGLGVGGVGLAMIILITVSPEGLNAPYWVAIAACGAFVFAGLSIIAHALGWSMVNALSNVLIVAALATPGFWIMLDPGPKACTGGFSFLAGGLGLSAGGAAPDWQCRLVFGAGAVITALIGVAMITVAVKRLRQRSVTRD